MSMTAVAGPSGPSGPSGSAETPEQIYDHVRRPELPWRVNPLTECGRRLDDVRTSISRDELAARLRRDGQQRTAFSVCMTCLSTAGRWPSWDADPVEAMAREFHGFRRHERLADELRAIAAIVEAHREEFDGYLQGLRETVSLDAARRAKRRR